MVHLCAVGLYRTLKGAGVTAESGFSFCYKGAASTKNLSTQGRAERWTMRMDRPFARCGGDPQKHFLCKQVYASCSTFVLGKIVTPPFNRSHSTCLWLLLDLVLVSYLSCVPLP